MTAFAVILFRLLPFPFDGLRRRYIDGFLQLSVEGFLPLLVEDVRRRYWDGCWFRWNWTASDAVWILQLLMPLVVYRLFHCHLDGLCSCKIDGLFRCHLTAYEVVIWTAVDSIVSVRPWNCNIDGFFVVFEGFCSFNLTAYAVVIWASFCRY